MTATPPKNSNPLEALKAAVAIVGGQAAMARLRGVSQPTVWNWIHKIGQLPAEHVLGVEADTGIPRSDLRPDIYPRGEASPSPGAAAATDGARGNVSPSRADSLRDPLLGLTP